MSGVTIAAENSGLSPGQGSFMMKAAVRREPAPRGVGEQAEDAVKDHQNVGPELELTGTGYDEDRGTAAASAPLGREVAAARIPDATPLLELQAVVQRLEAEVDSLHRALATREVIGQATGLVAAWLTIGTEQAWQVLRKVSSLVNVPVREVGRLLVASANGPVTGPDAETLRMVAEALLPARERTDRPEGHRGRLGTPGASTTGNR